MSENGLIKKQLALRELNKKIKLILTGLMIEKDESKKSFLKEEGDKTIKEMERLVLSN